MRYLQFLLVALFLFAGCRKELGPTRLPGPRTLSVEATGEDSLSLLLRWDRVEQAYAYVITLEDNPLDTVTDTFWVDSSVTELGEYRVWSWRDGELSDTFAAFSTQPVVVDSAGPIYGSSDTSRPSGFGWTSKGEGRPFSLARPDSVDIYYENQHPPGTRRLADVSVRYPSFPAHSVIAYGPDWEFDTIITVPDVEFSPYKPISESGAYLLRVRGYFIKLQILSHDTLQPCITFRYAFQPARGFKRFGF